MPGCVLRASGQDFDVEKFLATSPFNSCTVFRKGEPTSARLKKLRVQSDFNLVVSDDAIGGRESKQISEAAAFVKANRDELLRLVNWPGVESVAMDFGWNFDFGQSLALSNFFPPELLADCGKIGIGIEVSVYATTEDSTELFNTP